MELENKVEQSADITELAKALVKASIEVAHPKKNASNPHFKSRYVDLTATIDAFKPTFLAHGLVVTQMVAGNTLATTVMHTSGQWMRSHALVSPDKPTVQAFGSALTYMRRYTLQALAGLASDGDDDDGNLATTTAPQGSW
jgi:hypothetical protein